MDDDTAKILAAIGLLIFLIVIVILGPFFTVWSVNHLFDAKITMNFKTWCAVIWLMTVLRGINLAIKKSQ